MTWKGKLCVWGKCGAEPEFIGWLYPTREWVEKNFFVRFKYFGCAKHIGTPRQPIIKKYRDDSFHGILQNILVL